MVADGADSVYFTGYYVDSRLTTAATFISLRLREKYRYAKIVTF